MFYVNHDMDDVFINKFIRICRFYKFLYHYYTIVFSCKWQNFIENQAKS